MKIHVVRVRSAVSDFECEGQTCRISKSGSRVDLSTLP